MRTRHWCALCSSRYAVCAVTPTVPERGERQTVASCLQPLHSLAFAAPSTWSSSPGEGEEEGDLPAGIGLHIYPSSTLYPQDPYNQGTKADAPGLGSPATAPVQQPGKQCGKRIPSRSSSHKGTHKVRAARPGDSFL